MYASDFFFLLFHFLSFSSCNLPQLDTASYRRASNTRQLWTHPFLTIEKNRVGCKVKLQVLPVPIAVQWCKAPHLYPQSEEGQKDVFKMDAALLGDVDNTSPFCSSISGSQSLFQMKPASLPCPACGTGNCGTVSHTSGLGPSLHSLEQKLCLLNPIQCLA